MALMFMLLCLHVLDSYVGAQRRQAVRLHFLLCCLARVENSGLDLTWALLAYRVGRNLALYQARGAKQD
jgi:hypothetical protein